MNESIVQLNQMEYIPAFESRIEEHFQYTEDNMDVLQINVGKLCNLSCKHCLFQIPGPEEMRGRSFYQQ